MSEGIKYSFTNAEGNKVDVENKDKANIGAAGSGSAIPNNEGLRDKNIEGAFLAYLESLASDPDKAAEVAADLEAVVVALENNAENTITQKQRTTLALALGGMGLATGGVSFFVAGSLLGAGALATLIGGIGALERHLIQKDYTEPVQRVIEQLEKLKAVAETKQAELGSETEPTT